MTETFFTDKLSQSIELAVVDLLAKRFPGNYHAQEKLFRRLIKERPNQSFIISQNRKKVNGVLILLNRKMNYLGSSLSVCGMSYMATAPQKYGEKQVARALTDRLMQEWETNDLALGFARKKMDGYWSRYGFLGIHDFGTCTFPLSTMVAKNTGANLSFAKSNKDHIAFLEEAYPANNFALAGNLLRDDSIWNFIVDGLSVSSPKLQIITKDKNAIGYCFYEKNTIREIRCEREFWPDLKHLLKTHFRSNGYSEIEFCCNLNDPFIVYMKHDSHKQSIRYAFEGATILRINNEDRLLEKLKPIFQKRFIDLGIREFDAINGPLGIKMTNGVASFSLDNEKRAPRLKQELAKIIFGIREYEDHRLQTAFPKLYTSTPTLDTF